VNILIAESEAFSPAAADVLRGLGPVTLADLDREGLLRAVPDADVLWVRLRHRIDAEVMAAAPRLRAIVSPTTGLNHIDLDEAARRGIGVISLRGEVEFLKDVRATAEHTIGLMLALLRGLPAAAAHVREGGWDRGLFRGRELYGRTVGVVGYGRLGRLVTRYLTAFGSRVVVSDPRTDPGELEPGATLVDLDELLPEAQIVTLHASLSPDTEGLLSRPRIEAMRNGAWLVNSARGELVDEAALLDALRSGRLAGAALDVLSSERQEGMADHPLVAYARRHDNLIITPHIGGFTAESLDKTERFMAEALCGWVRDASTPVSR
jgi:D-3-phosphoglycerate dehydrogenase / 2-oxoglutarate reductase